MLLALCAAPGNTVAAAGGTEEKPAAPAASDRWERWLAEVAPLISDAERDAFRSLTKDYQRWAFISRFWQVRDPFPETARNELEDSWKERAEAARSRFEDLTHDRGRMMLLAGEPQRVSQVRCSEVLRPLEIWSYGSSPGARGGYALVFVEQAGGGEDRYRVWSPREGLFPLLTWTVAETPTDRQVLEAIAERCPRGDDVVSALAGAADPQALSKGLPHPSEEWLRTFMSRSTDLPEGAATFPAELHVGYPGRYQSRTVVQGLLTVPLQGVEPGTQSRYPSYDFVVDGEVLRQEELFESFRYRFHFPVEQVRGDRIPLVFQRYLRPGDYSLVLKVEDLGSGRFLHRVERLEVPSVGAARIAAMPPPAPRLPGAAGRPETDGDLLAEANADLAAGDQSVRLLPAAPGLLVGNTRLEAVTTGDRIARVRFRLDGRPVMSKGRPPYSVELDLGEAPRIHRVEAVALDVDGKEIARDETVLNAGPHRFAVRLVEPRRGGSYQASLRARAEVDVPEGETLDRVELYLNDTLVATLYQPPFIQPMVIPSGLDVAYVRAQAYLIDGTSTEDVVFVNAPDYLEEMDIHFVELYTTVLDRRGKAVEGLGRDDFRVTEEGVEQQIRRCERVTDTPIYAGVVLDTSASMFEEIREAVKAALRFFDTVLTPRDRAAVFTFSDEPHLAVRFTNNPEVLAGGLADIQAEGETALYDSLIQALYYFSGIQGKRALILISDGKDEGSRYHYEDVLEYARRTGVAIYAIGLGQAGVEREVQMKLARLANETGGRWFSIDRATELGSVYAEIEKELRSQYLITYQSSHEGTDDKYRTVDVEVVSHPGLETKTLRGYYP